MLKVVVLKSGTCLEKNTVQNPEVELVVVCTRILHLTSTCARSVCGAFRDLVEFLLSVSLLLNGVAKLLHPSQAKLYIQFCVLQS